MPPTIECGLQPKHVYQQPISDNVQYPNYIGTDMQPIDKEIKYNS